MMGAQLASATTLKCYFFALLLASINAEEKWSWSKNGNGNNNNNNKLSSNTDRLNVRSDVIEFQEPTRNGDAGRKFNQQQDVRQGRYEVKESTTKKPSTFGKPQNDEFSGEVNGNQQSDIGYNNQRFGGGLNGPYNPNQYGNPGFGGGNPYFGGGGGGVIGYPQQGFGGAYGGANGVLVGPEGPTGVIGRPYKGFNGGYPGTGFSPYGNSLGGGYENQGGYGRPGGFYPQGGVGGRPGGGYYGGQGQFGVGQHGPAQFGAGQFGAGQFGAGQFGSGQFGPGQFGAGQFGQGQFGQGQFGQGQFGHGQFGQGQFGQGQFRPGQYGGAGQFGGLGPIGGPFGGGPFGPQFDQAKQATKKIEKKSI